MTKKLRSKSTGKSAGKPAIRSTYRHGDLHRALLEAGIALARAGGPDAVVLREATRQAGVVPNAAYRHFASRQDLLEAVRSAALSELAKAMEAELEKGARKRGANTATASLRAVGIGYLQFALTETGLFRTAFSTPENLGLGPNPARSGRSGLNPFELLSAALDKMAEAGQLSPERRGGAEFLAWSAVHGFAMLVIDGPLRTVPRSQIEALGQRVVEMVEKGL
jgi:AcrR family transcriptional regulator